MRKSNIGKREQEIEGENSGTIEYVVLLAFVHKSLPNVFHRHPRIFQPRLNIMLSGPASVRF